jgi:sRNA-binding carbon storage regulator CsrA
VLVFSLQRGESFYVGDQRVKLLDFDGRSALLKTQGEKFRCPNHLTELPGAGPDVQVSAGQRTDRSIRIGIQAPYEIKVLRERLYLKDQQDKRPAPSRHSGKARRLYADAMECTLCRGTMLVKQDDDGEEVTLPCPRKQNRTLPLCEPSR